MMMLRRPVPAACKTSLLGIKSNIVIRCLSATVLTIGFARNHRVLNCAASPVASTLFSCKFI
jgi:hypothetical protein